MVIVTEEDIRKILRDKKGDKAETKDAKKITLLGYLFIIPSLFCWFVINIAGSNELSLAFPLVILIGSGFVGIVTFLIYMGNYIYFQYHETYLTIHWLYLGFMRTISQVYIMGSFIIIIIFTFRFYPNRDFGFIIIYLLFSLPASLGYYLFRREKTRTWFEDLVSTEKRQNPLHENQKK